MQQKRVQFDFTMTFTNGGGIQGQGFRLDIDGDTIADRELADYLIQDMHLLMVDEVLIFNKTIISEPHKRMPIAPRVDRSTFVDLSHCNLQTLPDQGFTFSAVPPKFHGVGTFPVRAFAQLAY